jgi:putative peptide zinc metalloprotease protein
MRLHLIPLAVLIAAATLVAPSVSTADNIVVAANTRDDTSVFRVSIAVRRVARDVVDDANVAIAVGSCSDCQTVAVALEAVLVFREPEVFTPTNLAFAINVGCSRCETLASAYQWAFATGGPVHFTADGNRRLARIRRELHALRHDDVSVWEIQAVVQRLADELADVLAHDLVAAGPPR